MIGQQQGDETRNDDDDSSSEKKGKKRNRAANKKWSTVSEVPPISHADTFQFCFGFLTHFCRPLYDAFACAFFVQDGLQREESQQHSQKQNKKKWTKERREGNQSATPFFCKHAHDFSRSLVFSSNNLLPADPNQITHDSSIFHCASFVISRFSDRPAAQLKSLKALCGCACKKTSIRALGKYCRVE